MRPETRQIIEAAIALDGTITDDRRQNIVSALQEPGEKPRFRISAAQARKRLGLSESTWLRRLSRNEDYAKLTVIREKAGKTYKHYYDASEIETLAAGVVVPKPTLDSAQESARTFIAGAA